jgi:hypothetical protein
MAHIVCGMLRPAEDDKAVIASRRIRHGLAMMGHAGIKLGAAGGKRLTDETNRRHRAMLEHENFHGPGFLWLKNPARRRNPTQPNGFGGARLGSFS